MKLLGAIFVAACGFSPNSASSGDAPIQIDSPKPIDAQIDGHDVTSPDAKVFMDATLPTFDPANCPAGYTNNTISASPNSRYLVTQAGSFGQVNTSCNGGHPGWTHLVVFDTAQEATQIRTAVNGFYYVGAVQPQNQATAATGWLWFTGAAVPANMWQQDQPNDNGGSDQENNEQNVAVSDDSTGLLNDSQTTYNFSGVCECDGLTIATDAQNAINDL
jgi:hypothetical protein